LLDFSCAIAFSYSVENHLIFTGAIFSPTSVDFSILQSATNHQFAVGEQILYRVGARIGQCGEVLRFAKNKVFIQFVNQDNTMIYDGMRYGWFYSPYDNIFVAPHRKFLAKVLNIEHKQLVDLSVTVTGDNESIQRCFFDEILMNPPEIIETRDGGNIKFIFVTINAVLYVHEATFCLQHEELLINVVLVNRIFQEDLEHRVPFVM